MRSEGREVVAFGVGRFVCCWNETDPLRVEPEFGKIAWRGRVTVM